LAAEIEKLVLQPPEDLDQASAGIATLLGGERAHDAEHGVELVDRAVGDDAGRVLGDAPAADESGLTAIAGSRVHASDANRHQPRFARSAYARPSGSPRSTGKPESRQPRAAGAPPNPPASLETSSNPTERSGSAAFCARTPDW